MTAPLDDQFGARWFTAMLATFDAEANTLGELDRRSGDGDFGTNLQSAWKRARSEAEKSAADSYTAYLTAVSRGFLGTGGTSGPLFGMLFRDLARCTQSAAPTLDELAAGLTAGLATVQKYGRAEVGHKTMVDALAPGSAALTAAVEAGQADPLAAAASAAREGALATSDITASRGRASYVGEVARGVIDPGAVAVALILMAAANAAQGTTDPADTTWAIADPQTI